MEYIWVLGITVFLLQSLTYTQVYGQEDVHNDPCAPATRPLILDDLNGVFTSPNYPNAYPINARCQWLLQSNSTSSSVMLDFTYFNTEECYDKVEIFDGPSTTSTLIRSACGTTIPGQTRTTQRYMTALFTSDSSVNNNGFRAKFTTDQACSAYRPRIVDVDVGDTVTVVSPYHSETYPDNVNCAWLIRSPGYPWTITAVPRSFNLENCLGCDKVSFYDGDSESAPPLANFTGSSAGEVFSTGYEMYMTFTTDSSVNRAGFQFEFSLFSTTTTPTEGTTYTPFITTSDSFETTEDTISTVTTYYPDTTFTPTPTPTMPPNSYLPIAVGVLNGTLTVSAPLDQDCLRIYTDVLRQRALQQVILINANMDSQICRIEGPGFEVSTINTIISTSGDETLVIMDVFVPGMLLKSFATHWNCVDNTLAYLRDHTNWNRPIIPNKPGCPNVEFNPQRFDILNKRWTCIN